jgi:hypothetical protein
MSAHASELTLRKVFAGESVAADLKAHSDACEQCRAKLKAIEEEQKRFEAAIPFERFSAGVERASRNPRQVEAPPRRQWMGYAMAIAASILVVAAVPLLTPRSPIIKGADGIQLIIGGPGPQRDATPNIVEALTSGERVEIKYSLNSSRYLIAVSVDESGEVTSIPERGESMLVKNRGQLPNSIEFTGHGTEHVVVVMTKDPLQVEDVRRALRQRYDEARGNLMQLGQLDIPGEQLHYSFLKP